jgi:alkanesulfonate monooxygenase SsuD/methylene tetrahydromethanopterin reductase-like flavin-dependent oxidoreductase (luciferase family)
VWTPGGSLRKNTQTASTAGDLSRSTPSATRSPRQRNAGAACYMGLTVSHDPAMLVRRRSMGHRGEVHVISGNPDEVTEQIAAYATVGVRHMQQNFLDFPRTDSLELVLSDVLPRFQ